MNKLLIFSILIVLMASVTACGSSGSHPEQVFAKIGLNGNKIPRSFQNVLRELREGKARGSLTMISGSDELKRGVSATEYVKHRYLNMFESDIKGLEELRSDEESQPIIEAGLDMFRYASDVFNTDFLRIAQMIDEESPEEEIDMAIEELDYSKGATLGEKYNRAMDLLLPYADKYGVEYNTHSLPF